MIAILVMGLGLLGFAMLQTMSVRYTKSAQDRTKASNLAYELVDLMRSQRSQASYYNTITYDSFDGATSADGVCTFPTGSTTAAAATPAKNITRWRCALRNALPTGSAQVQIGSTGLVTVSVKWTDAYWAQNTDDQSTTFTVRSSL
jgi:type IV pilus assembly protein PilV